MSIYSGPDGEGRGPDDGKVYGMDRSDAAGWALKRLFIRMTLFGLSMLAACLLGASVSGQGDSRLAVVPLDQVIEGSEFDACYGLVVSEDAVLILLPGRLPDRLEGAPGIQVADRPVRGPLWIAHGHVSEELARDAGVSLLFLTGPNTVFEADVADAYKLHSYGYFVVRLDFRPLSDLKRPPAGAGLLERLLRRRPLTPGRQHFIRQVSAGVDSSRLEDAVRWLSYDADRHGYRSRFAPRHEVEEEVVPYLEDLLTSHIEPNGGSVRTDEFKVSLGDSSSQYWGGDSTFINVIGFKPGARTTAYYVVCAHYDAIAARSSAWDWRSDPAPGADDNATGTAAVLECARILSGLELDVGVVFALFSGEELGLHGSKTYVKAYAATDTILGVINFDMVGYVEGGKQIEVWDDWKSEWLYSMLNEVRDSIGADVSLVPRFMPGIYNSDHASFWAVGIPGVMLADRTSNTIPVYPYYHTIGDTIGEIDIGQVWDAARLVVAAMARFVPAADESLPDLELTAESVEWKWDGRSGFRWPAGGDSLGAVIRPVNIGASMGGSQLYRLDVWRGEVTHGDLVHESTALLDLIAGDYATLDAGWELKQGLAGYTTYTFSLMPLGGLERNTANNVTQARLLVMSQALLIDDFHVQPNPVTDVSEAQLGFIITHPEADFDGRMNVRIFDILGKQIGYGLLKKTPTALDIDIGENRIDLSDLLAGGSDLAPGLYVCTAELGLIGEPGRALARCRFAVAR
jgi:hypothetical protein